MELNLPTGPGLLLVSSRSITIVNEKFKQTPIDGGAGKIKELDEKILEEMLKMGHRPKMLEMEADWIITKSSLFYINPNLGLMGGVFEFPFSDWVINVGKNRSYGFKRLFSSMKIINRKNKNINFDFKTGSSAQLNIVYVFNKYKDIST